MIIIACLGNPGKKYSKTRHNIGFLFGEMLSNTNSINIKQKSFNAISGTGKIEEIDCILLFPQTYMNNSGESVQSCLSFYKEKPEHIIAIHDEIELPFGECKFKFGGGHKGHNGIRSITSICKTPDFHRLRFGVGRPDNPNIPVADFVLSNFTKEELLKIPEIYENLYSQLCNLIKEI